MELECIHAVLRKVDDVPHDQLDEQVKIWARQLREASYDMEDVVDTFLVRVDGSEPADTRKSKRVRSDCPSDEIADAIKGINEKLQEVASSWHRRYMVDGILANPAAPMTTVDPRIFSLYKKATDLVGIDRPMDDHELIKMLSLGSDIGVSDNKMKIVSVVGSGGLGKTTLAKAVYDKLQPGFDCGAFVSVGRNPDVKKVFRDILIDLDEEKYENLNLMMFDEGQLIKKVHKFLRKKRYFIVIDDIWKNDVWKTIKYALVENEQGSRILTTTRILDVAEQAGGVYQLKPLSPADSSKLFYMGIFGSEDKCPPRQLAEVSENILKKCGGVPLAIITIASMLAGKKAKEHKYWYEVYQSMGSGLGDSPDVKDMRRILSISYYDLPPHLKTCLLYLSLYPEDYEIKREDLIWRWVGEGFVQKEQGKSLSEVGEDYFVELINKSLIQPGFYDEEKTVSSCRVHDMVLDLITSLSNEEYFLTTVGGQQPMPRNGKVRRLSLQTSNKDAIKQMSGVSSAHVRSLVVFKTAFSLLTHLSRFPVLRVLDLSDCDQVDNHHFKHICSLFHLRYLNLEDTSITEIPREIKNLQFLQVLDIRGTAIEELPSTFVPLGQLVCLKVDRDVRLPSSINMVSRSIHVVPSWWASLSSLSNIVIKLKRLGEGDLRVLGSIPSLDHLFIKVEEPSVDRDGRLVIGSGYPFLCLTQFEIFAETMEVVFAQGAMQKLRKLSLDFQVRKTMDRFGDVDLGLENLTSLERVEVYLREVTWMKAMPGQVEAAEAAVCKAVDMNPNNPTLDLKKCGS